MMKKNIFLSVSFLLISLTIFAQNVFPTDGNVGIGTTNPSSNVDIVKNNATLFVRDPRDISGADATLRLQTGGQVQRFKFVWNDRLTVDSGEGSDEQFTIKRNGNIGIGTANPQAKLEVKGAVRFSEGRLTHSGDMPNDNNAVFTNTAPTGYGIYSKGGLGTHYAFHFENQAGNSIMLGRGNGNVGIGTIDPKGYKLAVNGKIHAKEIKVDLSGWPDFVFEDTYNLPALKEVENHILQKGHLKDIPSAKEVEKNGIQLGEMNAKLLQKIEELTLYMIEQNKITEQLQKEVILLKKKNIELENKLK